MKHASIKKKSNVKETATGSELSKLNGEQTLVLLKDIDPSPLNYRTVFNEQSLIDFASELAIHGIISPMTVRKKKDNRYELVVGERRYRAAKIAKLKEVPVVIKPLSDDQVEELQLAENIQREDPHPMHEALGIGKLNAKKLTIDEIATRLGKSKQFVYLRIRLLNLIPSIREVFINDKLTIKQAIDIAGLSSDSQEQFFESHCKNWQEKTFEIYNLYNILSKFKCNLKTAPFNTKDKKLIPDVGACTGCSFNSASIKSLFPDLAKESVCSNFSCYEKKCQAGISGQIISLVKEHKPDAFVGDYDDLERLEEALANLPEEYHLPMHKYYEVTIIHPPEMPDKENYSGLQWETGNESDEEQPDEEGFNEALYNEDMASYELELKEYNDNKASGHYKIALSFDDGDIDVVLFSPEPSSVEKKSQTGKAFTMAFLDDAIKSKTATPKMIDNGKQLLVQKEERAKQLDKEKIQLKVYDALEEKCNNDQTGLLTDADLLAGRLIIYESLSYTGRQKAASLLFNTSNEEEKNEKPLLEQLKSLTDSQFALLIRLAILFKSDSKYPNSSSATALYHIAASAGINIEEIEKLQQEKADERAERFNTKIQVLEKVKSKLPTND